MFWEVQKRWMNYGVNVVNINYNLDTLDDKNLAKLYEKYQMLFNQLGINQVKINNE